MKNETESTTSRQTLSASVLEQIKQILWSGRVMPGEQLSIRKTAEALGVSMMPVRDAFSRLVADHALEVTPNRSVRVPVLKVETFMEITRIRYQIEGMAIAEAAGKASATLLADISRINDTLSREMAKPQADTQELVSLNQQFHFAIYEAAAMPVLFQMIESMWLRIGPILNYDLRQGSPRTREQVAVAHHRAMIGALQRGDADAARNAVVADIREAFEYIISRKPSLFLLPDGYSPGG
ncbi:GntR family transcriptional regulator [Advenella mimigardefordensis]|uniref:Transcriptional regulator, GntR family n=1 Tax=Advenella mimigardefordensis (strain DSM 17166 / LMG 22922 / DPN7) TaxID=1247726 RepID=W0PKJ4_ADVMD|nr:GntR family transcriptional regulator [Advenella mimigardefordensis]AHG66080.1 transcriptional regulator, GntR family [Advenella mimigardefordensis DPN7]